MIKIFVDTCVWQHWLALRAEKHFTNPDLEANAKAFEKIYEIVSSYAQKFMFLYSARIEGELPDEYLCKLAFCFQKVKQSDFIQQVVIPLSRADGTYRADGSLSFGGRLGGTLRIILSIDGYDHEEQLKKAIPNFRRENPAHTNPRSKEFDIEHLESALEASADFFLTTDQPLIDRLDRARKIYPENKEVSWGSRICMRPVAALLKLASTEDSKVG